MKAHFGYIDLVLWPSAKGSARPSVARACLCFLWVFSYLVKAAVRSQVQYPEMPQIRSQRKSEMPDSQDYTRVGMRVALLHV